MIDRVVFDKNTENMDMHESEKDTILDIEINLLMKAIQDQYGYSFHNYSRDYIRRRVLKIIKEEGVSNVSELQHMVLYNQQVFERVLLRMSIHVTEMFRDPMYFRYIRNSLLPQLASHSHIKIWHAGCSTGEEVYSMAILLTEANLYHRSTIYATDFNEIVLKKAADGIFNLEQVQQFTRNYQAAGGQCSFANYFHSHYEYAIIDHNLKKNIIFADHNLVDGHEFGKMQLIMCRNVLIYFDHQLQRRVLRLLAGSVQPGGFLGLGMSESLSEINFLPFTFFKLSQFPIYQKRLT